jgi:hypothetical protein
MRHPAGLAPTDEGIALSPAWLTAALERRHPGVVVTDVEVRERIKTVATKVRFHVTYAESRPELPTDLCIKGFFTDDWQQRPGLTTEAVFYRDVASTLPVRVPPCEYAGVDESSGHGLVLMHDLVVGGATFGDPSDTLTADESAAVLDQLAHLHAATWGIPGSSLPRDLEPRLPWLATLLDPQELAALLADGRAAAVPAEVADGHRVHAAMGAMAALTGTRCLVHGDLHSGNLYVLDGAPGPIDWQVAQVGSWALDVAYHVAAALDPEERARSERDLLDHYLDRLAARGVAAPDRDDAWWAYRAHLPYGFFMWGITRFTPRPFIEHFTHRLGLAVAEHGSLEILGV